MKRIIEILLCASLVLCMGGCGKKTPTSESSTTTTASQASRASESESVSESNEVTETEAPTESTTAAGSDILVIYFSATGTTKGIAEKIAEFTSADLYEITAAIPYSDEDREWTNSDSRCTKEQNDTSVRPEISSEKISLDGYTTIYIGYPIWFGQEPRIMDTFVESYNFDGITMIPFCTSGSSGIGQSGKNLAANAGSGNWIEGKRFAGNASDEEIKEWVESMGKLMV